MLVVSDVSQFDMDKLQIDLAAIFGFFLLFSFVLIYLTSFLYKSRILKLGAWGISVILVCGLIQSFIFTGEYGVMNHFVLQNPDFSHLRPKWTRALEILGIIVIAMIICYVLLERLRIILKILFATLVIVSIINLIQIDKNIKALNTSSTESAKNSVPYENELMSYSKNEKNIVVIVLDAFSGSHMKPLLEQFPEFRDKLDGFTLFDNSVSSAPQTVLSLPSIVAGEKYTIYNMNLVESKKMGEKIHEAYANTSKAFMQGGFNTGFFIPAVVINFDSAFGESGAYAVNDYKAFIPYYTKQNDLQDLYAKYDNNSKFTIISNLLSYGLFKSSFEPLRSRIYRYGYWLSGNDHTGFFAHLNYTAPLYAFLHNGNLDSTKPTFKFIHSLMTHGPFALAYIDNKCQWLDTRTAWEQYPHSVKMGDKPMAAFSELTPEVIAEFNASMRQHYDAEACALSYVSDYVAWLKENGIYDNTQIIIVSDHSVNDKIGINVDSHVDTLFLFKDFKQSGQLRFDHRLMTNYDAASIFCSNLESGCKSVPKNILENYPQNRTLYHNVIDHKATKGLLSVLNQWEAKYIYKVSGSIYGENSWQDITQEYNKDKSIIGDEN